MTAPALTEPQQRIYWALRHMPPARWRHVQAGLRQNGVPLPLARVLAWQPEHWNLAAAFVAVFDGAPDPAGDA